MFEWIRNIPQSLKTSSRRGSTTPESTYDGFTTADTDSTGLAIRWVEDGTAGHDPADHTPMCGPRPFSRSYAWLRALLAAAAAFLSARSMGWKVTAEDSSEAERLNRIDQNNQPRIPPLRDMWVRLVREHERFVIKFGPLMYRAAGIGAKRRYWFVVYVLVVTDIGMIVASNSNGAGDPIVWALLQGLGTGTSIMACGQLGALAREDHERSKRPAGSPQGFEHCAVWFGDSHGSSDWTNHALGAGFGLLFFIQMAMRTPNGGPIDGVGFAALAMILLLGSAANAYTYGAADPISRYADQITADAAKAATDLERLEAPGASAAKLTRRATHMMRHHTDLGRAAGKITLAEGAHTAASIAHPDVYGYYDSDNGTGTDDEPTANETDDVEPAVKNSNGKGPDGDHDTGLQRNGKIGRHARRPAVDPPLNADDDNSGQVA